MQRRFLGFSLATAVAGARYRTCVALAVCGLLVATAGPLGAHHAIQAEFD